MNKLMSKETKNAIKEAVLAVRKAGNQSQPKTEIKYEYSKAEASCGPLLVEEGGGEINLRPGAINYYINPPYLLGH